MLRSQTQGGTQGGTRVWPRVWPQGRPQGGPHVGPPHMNQAAAPVAKESTFKDRLGGFVKAVLWATVSSGPSIACLVICAIAVIVAIRRLIRERGRELKHWISVVAAVMIGVGAALVAALLSRVLGIVPVPFISQGAYVVPLVYFLIYMFRNWGDLWSFVGSFFKGMTRLI